MRPPSTIVTAPFVPPSYLHSNSEITPPQYPAYKATCGALSDPPGGKFGSATLVPIIAIETSVKKALNRNHTSLLVPFQQVAGP